MATKSTNTRIKFGDQYEGEKLRQLEQQVATQASMIRRLETMLFGGQSGQVLSKVSNKDLDGFWQNPTGGSGGDTDAENLGDGEGLFTEKVGDNLQFKSLKVDGTLSIEADDETITISGEGGEGSGVVESVVGTSSEIEVDSTDPANPVVGLPSSVMTNLSLASTALQPGEAVESVVGTTNRITVDPTDPANPVVDLDAPVVTSLGLADSAVQPGDLAAIATSGDSADASYDPTLSGLTATNVQDAVDELAVDGITAKFAPETRGASFTGGTSAIIAPTNKVPINIREDCEIVGVVVLTQGGTGSCVLDIWKHPYGTYPPSVADSICGSAKPTISSDVKYSDATLTGWTTVLSAGDTLLVNLESSSTFTVVSLFLILAPVGSTALDGYTDERARDVIGTALTDTATVIWNVNDAGDTIEADVDTTALDLFTDTDPGIVPASSDDPDEVLCGDGVWRTGGVVGQTSGTFTGTLTYGVTPSTTGNDTGYRWVKIGTQVWLFLPNHNITPAADSGTTLVLSGIPSGIRPTRESSVTCLCVNGGGAAPLPGSMTIRTDGTAQLFVQDFTGTGVISPDFASGSNVGFYAIGTSGQGQWVTYSLN